MSAQQILYIFSSGPYSNAAGQEGLDALLMGVAFEQEVSALFLHDGVFQLKKGQRAGTTGLKQYTRTYQALRDFEVQDIYVFDTSLAARGLDLASLTIEARVLNNQGIIDLINQQHRVFTF